MRIVVRHLELRRARAAQAALAAAGIAASATPGPYRPAPDGEDIAIFVGDDSEARALAKGARSPLVRLAALTLDAPPQTHPPCAFDGAIALDAPTKLLAAQVEAHTRLAVALDERARRALTAAMFGAVAPKRTLAGAPKALFIGAPSPTFLALQHAFAAQGGAIAAAFSSFAGFDYLHDEPFDAVVLNGAVDAPTALSLCAALRRNARLCHLPTLMLTAPGDARTHDGAVQRGACVIVATQAPLAAPLGWLGEAIRRERLRREAEQELEALRDLLGEARTGLFRSGAFETHLARMADDHHASGRPLALALLRVMPAPGARAPSDAAWRKGFAEIASLAAQLIRPADSGAAIGADCIAVALPAADTLAARRCTERIASVAECTAFAANEDGAGPLVLEQCAVELQPGESGASLLARALRGFEIDRASA